MRPIKKIAEPIWLLVVLLLGVLSACGGQNGRQAFTEDIQGKTTQITGSEPVILFDTLEHDFGTIIEGEKVLCYFDYINDGGSELMIESVEATCGCTSPNWNKEALPPGKGHRLELIFDASGRRGTQRKLVKVRSNAKNQQVTLIVKANVINGV